MKIVEVKSHPLLTHFRGPGITRAQRAAPLCPLSDIFYFQQVVQRRTD